MLRNTTNIPDALIGAAIAHGLSEGQPLPEVVEVKNKKNGHIAGQWGWYWPREKRVVVIVPRWIPPDGYTSTLKYIKKPITFGSRGEFLVAVMAHELRHGYQRWKWDTPEGRWRLKHDKLGHLAKEVDAEMWELARLEAWRLKFTR